MKWILIGLLVVTAALINQIDWQYDLIERIKARAGLQEQEIRSGREEINRLSLELRACQDVNRRRIE